MSISDELLAAAKGRAREWRRELAAVPDGSARPAVPIFQGGTGPGPGST